MVLGHDYFLQELLNRSSDKNDAFLAVPNHGIEPFIPVLQKEILLGNK
jgi:hypothetical protein